MTNEEYLQTQQHLVLLAGMVRQLDLGEFLSRIEKADGIAPILDPTLWMKGHSRLDAIRDLARGAAAFRAASEKFLKTMEEIEAKEKR